MSVKYLHFEFLSQHGRNLTRYGSKLGFDQTVPYPTRYNRVVKIYTFFHFVSRLQFGYFFQEDFIGQKKEKENNTTQQKIILFFPPFNWLATTTHESFWETQIYNIYIINLRKKYNRGWLLYTK